MPFCIPSHSLICKIPPRASLGRNDNKEKIGRNDNKEKIGRNDNKEKIGRNDTFLLFAYDDDSAICFLDTRYSAANAAGKYDGKWMYAGLDCFAIARNDD